METLSETTIRETLEKIKCLKTLEEAKALYEELTKLHDDVLRSQGSEITV